MGFVIDLLTTLFDGDSSLIVWGFWCTYVIWVIGLVHCSEFYFFWLIVVIVSSLGFCVFCLAELVKVAKERMLFGKWRRVVTYLLAIIKSIEVLMLNIILLIVPKVGMIRVSNDDVSVLHWAVSHGYMDTIDTLVNGRLHLYQRNKQWYGSRRIFHGLQLMIDWFKLSEYTTKDFDTICLDSDANTTALLRIATEKNNPEGIHLLLKNGTPEYREYKSTALHLAVANNYVECVKELLQNTKPEYHEAKDNATFTALHLAACKNYSECVELLLQNSRPQFRELKDWNRNTALHLAVLNKSPECVQLLLQDVGSQYRQIRNENGETALHLAASKGHMDCVQHLLQNASPEYREMKTSEKDTALHLAAYKGHTECVKLLLQNASPEYPEMKTYNGDTCLHRACRAQNETVVPLLLKDARPAYDQIKNKAGKKAVECCFPSHPVVKMVLTAKYMRMVLSLSEAPLYVMNDNDMFWCPDSIVKDTFPWMRVEHFDLKAHSIETYFRWYRR
eukprot:TRINITY_DN1659_c0_g1_i1.p1 TRINITY_DN1659_c0_g1~~TRINITY_DN1659_c0_g1_i1.p1  ORF type:complete len:505 (+),score=24.80 TRINITY_DN1659_c0_g1_i1:159-1673(+)